MSAPDTRSRRAPACPICGKPSAPDQRPFCSTRCADVDLGRWLGERYVIPGPETEGDEDGAAGTDRRTDRD